MGGSPETGRFEELSGMMNGVSKVFIVALQKRCTVCLEKSRSRVKEILVFPTDRPQPNVKRPAVILGLSFQFGHVVYRYSVEYLN
jgi:hypothetical protein